MLSGRFPVGPRRTAGDPAPPPAPSAPDPSATLPAPAAALTAPTAAVASDPARVSASSGDSTPSFFTQPAPAIGSKLDDVDPDTAVSLGLPDAFPTTAAPPAPKVPSPGGTGALPAPNASATANSADPDLTSLLGGDSDPDADARAQYQRDTTATNRYLKSQGGLTTITPTGQEVPALDANGNQLYKGAVIQPFVRGDDGNAYRVSRDQYGNQHYFNIADGADGTDFHTDPATGEQFVQVPGADGASRRETVGQDNFIPAANGIKALAQSHQNDAEQAGLAAGQAEQGVAGAPGLGSLPLSNLKQQQTATSQVLTKAQQVIAQGDQFRAQGGTFTGPMLTQYRQALDQADQFGSHAQDLDSEITSRQQAITAAQQQRTASMGAFRDAQLVRNQIQAARTDEGSTLSRNLQAVAAGQDIDQAQARRYTAAGLLTSQPQADGSTAFQLTDTAKALLPTPNAPTPAPAPVGQALLNEFPDISRPGSTANQTFIRAFQRAGSDPRRALQVARAVFGTAASTLR